MRQRPGLTIIEMIVAVIVLGIVGGGIVRMLTSQARFYEHQGAGRNARSISRAATNVLLSEMRMVEAPGGVVAASATSITLRVPYAVGVYCEFAGGGSTIALLPTDSAMLAEPGFSGYAWRGLLGQYTYVEGGAAIGNAGLGACIGGANITPMPGGRVISLTPALPSGVPSGAVVLLTRRITYDFAPSTTMPGRRALWRRVVATGAAEELVAPFDATARFRFYNLNANTAQDAVPVLANIRGLEFVLVGASESSPRLTGAPQRSNVTTSVFFRNRL
jgi:type II secretory pathway pseudopilin PulG